MVERTERRLDRAIILAAGTGSRLVAQEAFPKPLKPIAGVPLLIRVLRTLQGEGIREAVVVIGYRGDQIRRALLAEPSLALTLHFVENDRFDRKNGVSLLAAKNFIDQECILSMADHLYSPEAVRRLAKFELPRGACALGVDYDIERCFDLDDATKVARRGRQDRRHRQGARRLQLHRHGRVSHRTRARSPSSQRSRARRATARSPTACARSPARRVLWLRRGRRPLDRRGHAGSDRVRRSHAARVRRLPGRRAGGREPPVSIGEGIEFFAPSWVRAAQALQRGSLRDRRRHARACCA